ncbi:hypothetical protein [Moorena sp. SIO3I8]|nr:hypothetical protein [Moorena sp. SIO3I8]NEO08715.1 hypothetical protein [Moorena sp. SIO3I8]NEO24820.1 hypothetical protein [Moorena sp. SIO4A5]
MERACWWNGHLARILPQPDNQITFNQITFNQITFNQITFNLQPSTK